jgi:hypothetical protein
MRIRAFAVLAGLCLLVGCAGDKPHGDLPPMHHAHGKVIHNGMPVAGGHIQFQAEPATPDLIVNAEVRPDGTFELQTLHALSQKKAIGAPAGTYRVTYMPPATDQNIVPVIPTETFVIKEGLNELTIDLGKK